MTSAQKVVLIVILLLLLVVTGLLAVTLINNDDDASPVPTLALMPTTTAPSTRSSLGTATPVTVPPTWTPLPTRTPPFTITPRNTQTATSPPTITPTFAPTFTPRPTKVVTTEVSALPILYNPDFKGVGGDTIPGWSWWALDNYTPGGNYNPDTSYETPLFKQADDPARFIDGPTLQIDAVQHLKFQVHVYQTVPVSPTAQIGFQVLAGAYSDSGAVKLAAGIDPEGGPDCANAQWSDFVSLDQNGGVQSITAPQVAAGDEGLITVCLYAEPFYAAISNAAFFDAAHLTVTP